MSLQVWLPLLGNNNNQGLGTITSVSGTPSYKTPGKLGTNALNLKTRITYVCPQLANLQTFTVAFWGMPQSSDTLTTNWQDLIGFNDVSSSGTAGTFRWETTYASSDGLHWHDNATNALVNGAHDHIKVKNQWVHCCVVFDYAKGQIYSYDNGVLTQTHTHAGGKFNTTGTFYLGETNNIEGMIQDVRFYDHALSNKEVEELAKGLVLHYKLDGYPGGTNANYLSYSQLIKKINNIPNTNSNYTQSFENIEGFDCWHVHSETFGVSGYLGWNIAPIINSYPIGTKFTLSGWIKTDNIQKGTTNYFSTLYYGGSYNNNGTSTWIGEGSRLYTNINNDAFNLSGLGWTYCYIVSTFQRNDYTNMMADYYLRDFKGDIYLREFKFEVSDTPTPWIPKDDEVNYNANIFYDCSGYNNNGEIYRYDTNGSILTNNDSPKHTLSTFINSSNNTTNTASGTIYIYGHCGLTTPNQMSVAFWCKPIAGYGNSTTQGQFCTTTYEYGNANAGSDYQGSAMNHRDGAIDINDSSSTTQIRPSIGFIANEWHHYAITYDGQNGKTYRDGTLIATASFSSAKSLDSFIGVIIGFSKAGGVWRSNQSYYSDFRVYATCLNINQIQELYNTSASIDNKGNIYTRELIEL